MIRLISRNSIRLFPLFSPKAVSISSTRKYADGFSFLFPDVPEDDASNNYMLNLPKQGEPINFERIDPHESFRAVLKTLFELEGCYEELTACDIKNMELDFDKIYNEIDEKIVSLNYAYSMFDLMFAFRSDRFMLRKGGNTGLIKAYNNARSCAHKSKTIFKIMLELDKQGDKLSLQQRRVIKKYITEGKLNGLHLKTELVIDEIKRTIESYTEDFMSNVNTDSRNFIQRINNPEYAKALPNNMKSMVESKSIVNLTYSPAVYEHFLGNCDDQDARYNYWYAYNNRASLTRCNRRISNNILVDDIILQRRSLAENIGFVNFIEYALQTRTLDSILTIKEFIEKLFEQSRDVYYQDLNQILQFTTRFPDFRAKELKIWDLSYFQTQLRNRNLQALKSEINQYFPVSKVIKGLFKFLDDNLNVKMEKLDNKYLNEKNPIGDTVEYYRVYHHDKFVGNFYLNLFSKLKVPQVRNMTDHCGQLDVSPIVGLFLNIDRPVEGQAVTITFNEAASLFQSFGYVIDHLLPTNRYAECSGSNSINRDFRDLTSNIFGLFGLHDYDTIKECSENVFTGEQLPESLFSDYLNAFLKLRSLNLTEEIYRAALDFALYTQTQASIDITRDIYNKYMHPFDFGKENFHICSDISLLCGPNVGTQYCKLYSQVLAADLFMLTYDNQGNNQNRFDLLDAYVNNFLLDERGADNLDAFKKIRGRDFSIKPFLSLNQYDLQLSSVEKANAQL